jgi:hypothetical protein
MRVLRIHPNCHSRGAGIAGRWPLAWVALKRRAEARSNPSRPPAQA